jgi:transposase InsO family protein
MMAARYGKTVADVTHIPTREGWLYLAVAEDLFSRMIVGWSMDATMTGRLVTANVYTRIRPELAGAADRLKL